MFTGSLSSVSSSLRPILQTAATLQARNASVTEVKKVIAEWKELRTHPESLPSDISIEKIESEITLLRNFKNALRQQGTLALPLSDLIPSNVPTISSSQIASVDTDPLDELWEIYADGRLEPSEPAIQNPSSMEIQSFSSIPSISSNFGQKDTEVMSGFVTAFLKTLLKTISVNETEVEAMLPEITHSILMAFSQLGLDINALKDISEDEIEETIKMISSGMEGVQITGMPPISPFGGFSTFSTMQHSPTPTLPSDTVISSSTPPSEEPIDQGPVSHEDAMWEIYGDGGPKPENYGHELSQPVPPSKSVPKKPDDNGEPDWGKELYDM